MTAYHLLRPWPVTIPPRLATTVVRHTSLSVPNCHSYARQQNILLEQKKMHHTRHSQSNDKRPRANRRDCCSRCIYEWVAPADAPSATKCVCVALRRKNESSLHVQRARDLPGDTLVESAPLTDGVPKERRMTSPRYVRARTTRSAYRAEAV